MKYFRPDQETIAADIARITSGLLNGIDEHLAGADPLDEEAVHEIRKSCKRLRALLRLIRAALPDSAFREADRAVRKLAVRLGQARDQAVMLATIDRVTRHYAPVLDGALFAPVRHWLQETTHDSTGPTGAAAVPTCLRPALDRLRLLFCNFDLQDQGTGILVTGLLDSYRRGRRALHAVQQQPDAEPVHALRRHTKYLSNQLGMLVALDRAYLAPLAELAHDVEDTLGEVHDLNVLTDACLRAPPLRHDPLRREVLMSLLEARWIRQLSGILGPATSLYAQKPAAFRTDLAQHIDAD